MEDKMSSLVLVVSVLTLAFIGKSKAIGSLESTVHFNGGAGNSSAETPANETWLMEERGAKAGEDQTEVPCSHEHQCAIVCAPNVGECVDHFCKCTIAIAQSEPSLHDASEFLCSGHSTHCRLACPKELPDGKCEESGEESGGQKQCFCAKHKLKVPLKKANEHFRFEKFDDPCRDKDNGLEECKRRCPKNTKGECCSLEPDGLYKDDFCFCTFLVSSTGANSETTKYFVTPYEAKERHVLIEHAVVKRHDVWQGRTTKMELARLDPCTGTRFHKDGEHGACLEACLSHNGLCAKLKSESASQSKHCFCGLDRRTVDTLVPLYEATHPAQA